MRLTKKGFCKRNYIILIFPWTKILFLVDLQNEVNIKLN